MSDRQELSANLPAFLRAIADELEHDDALAERIAKHMGEGGGKKRTRNGNAVIGFDPFQVLRQGTTTALRERLEALELPGLKAIITQHNLDTTRLAQKWRDKDRLVAFILERISARAGKGDVFKAVEQAAASQ